MGKIWVMQWEECERGFGVRPDGWSLHASQEDGAAYVKAYWTRMPDAAPDEYECPSWPAARPFEASAALAEWVASGDRRIARSRGGIASSTFELSDPELLERVAEEFEVKTRVRSERSAIESSAAPALESGRKPAL